MRKLCAFLQMSLDGYVADERGDIRWAKGHTDPEFQAFVEENAKGGGELVFGRVTYDMMASYWPTPLAAQHDPVVAERMNQMPKIVFSRTLTAAAWQNTRLVTGDLATEARRLKEDAGPDIAILGSVSIVSQLSEAGLIDEFQIVVNPILLGAGRKAFEGVKRRIELRMTRSRTFRNGNVFVCYEPGEKK